MSGEAEVETKYCSNCKKDIAAANFTMHEVHCRRHLVLCQHCEEPVPRTELEQHFNDVHAKIDCTLCGDEFEKDQLDTHVENECPKRKVPCEYCELEMPQDEMAAHLEYCGTRTEACPRCSAYIMHKDRLQHTSSNCTYPPAQTNNSDRGVGGDGVGPAGDRAFQGLYEFGTFDFAPSFDPFVFSEIHQALSGVRGDPFQSLLDPGASAAAGERGTVIDMNRRAAKNGRGPVRKNEVRGSGPAQRNNVSSSRKTTTNRRSDLNRQRDTEPVIPPDMDYDTMLAMQLATEDSDDADPDAHLNQLMSSFGKKSRQPVRRNISQDDVPYPSTPPEHTEFDASDEEMIPCEFCGETFPPFALVHHQSVCDPLSSGIWGLAEDVPPVRNNEPQLVSRFSPSVSRPAAIPVIDNLGSASPAQEPEVQENYRPIDSEFTLNSLESTMLPCEFCSELLPADVLVQHQAICEGQSSSTPRVMTPAAAQPSGGAPGAPRSHFFPTSPTRSRRHQPDPTEELLTAIAGRGAEEIPAASRAGTKKKSGSTASRSTVGRHNAPSELQIGSQGGSRSRRTPEDLSLHPRGFRSSAQGRNENSSTRTRHTLDRLLSDDDATGQGSSSNRGSKRKEPTVGPTSVSSRTVMQTMRQEQQRSNRRSANNSDRSDEGTVDLSGRRQRERDHVFNGPDNSRAQPNQPRSRRSNRQLPGWN